MNDTINNIPLLNETSQYKLLDVTINGTPLRSQDIIDIQINFNQSIKGRLSFVDTMGSIELMPITYAVLEITYIDSADLKYDGTFIITEAKTVRIKDNVINSIIKFEDIRFDLLSNSYISRAFSGKTMMEMLEIVFTEINMAAIFYHGKNEHIYEHFVFPANISLMKFITEQIKYSNIVMYSDKNSIFFVPKHFVDYSNLNDTSEKPFVLNRDETKPYWNILEYEANISNVKVLRGAATANKHNVLPESLMYSPEDVSITTVYDSQKINGYMGMGKSTTLSDYVNEIGKKEISHIFHNEILGQNEDYRDIINKNQVVTIVVQGLNITRIFTKVEIKLPRAQAIQTNEDDEVYSGVFVVTEIIDKIIAGNFVQFLTLQASDYGHGSAHVWGD